MGKKEKYLYHQILPLSSVLQQLNQPRKTTKLLKIRLSYVQLSFTQDYMHIM